MIVRTSALNTTRRTLPTDRQPIVRRAVIARSQIDAFQPAAAPQALVSSQSAATAVAPTSSSSSGGIKGFFSGLWSRIKNVASGLLGQAGQFVTSKMGGWISSATSWVSNAVGGLLTKAGNWFTNLLSSWSQKLLS